MIVKRYYKIIKNWELYLFVLPVLIYFLVFHYWPMYGVQIAFKDFMETKGIWGSEWVGLSHFQRFFRSHYFWALIKNTMGISLYSLIVGFPVPIILALLLNEVKNKTYKNLVQTVTYAPHFISVVVLSGMVISFLSPETGIINQIIKIFGGTPVAFMQEAKWFKTIFVLSGVWQNAGWSSIVYLAALSGIDPQQHEAALIDGATKLQRIWYINLMGILPTMVILLILNTGSIMSIGFEKIYLLQNPLNMDTSDVISTYVYRSGLLGGEYSFSAAVGFFNSIVNFILLISVNYVSKKLNETSLW